MWGFGVSGVWVLCIQGSRGLGFTGLGLSGFQGFGCLRALGPVCFWVILGV